MRLDSWGISRRLAVGTFALAGLIGATGVAGAQVSIPSYATAVTQDFNTLASAGTSSAVPAGWAFVETGSNANLTYTAGTGSSLTGDTFSFGATGNGERAFGGLLSGTLVPTIGAQFINNTGGVIGSLDITYTGEEWRCGTVSRTDRLDFQYSLDATSLSTGTWTDVDALDFITPNTATFGVQDGNAVGNRTPLLASITALSINPSATFWIRWTDFNATGSDDGLSVDDFSIMAQEPPVPTRPATWGGVKSLYR